MDKIFTLPEYLGRDNLWVETNDALTNISEIKLDQELCWIPRHIYNDSIANSDIVEEYLEERSGYMIYPVSAFSDIQKARSLAYRVCVWYPVIEGLIPTAKTLLFSVNEYSDLSEIISHNIEYYPFVRLCSKSAKDIRDPPVYKKDNYQQAIEDIKNSERTNLPGIPCPCDTRTHLVMRKKRDYYWEARCFWSRDKLTAVSMEPGLDYTGKECELVQNFFRKYRREIPYHSAIIDVGYTDMGLS